MPESAPMNAPDTQERTDAPSIDDQGVDSAALSDFEPINLDAYELLEARTPLWRRSPHQCLAESATDPLDALLLEHLRLFDQEVRKCWEAANTLEDLSGRSQYINLADPFMGHVRMIHDHRNKYRNYGRQEITLTEETDAAPSRPPKPSRPMQNAISNEGTTGLNGGEAWRQIPNAFLTTLAEDASETILLEQIATLDDELCRCLAEANRSFDPVGSAPFAKLALNYAKKVLQIADSFRKPRAKGRQQIVLKRETVPAPVRRPRHGAASRHRRTPRAKTSIAI